MTDKALETKEMLGNAGIKDLMYRANCINADSSDFDIKDATTANVRFFEGSTHIRFIDDTYDIHEYPMSPYALSQVSNKLGVPFSYMSRCLDNGYHDLAADNLNWWMGDYHKDLFIRAYAGRIRGVLSGKYSVCDSHEILEVLSDCVDLNTYKTKGSYLSEERLHLRLVSNEMLNIKGEDLFPALFIDSSDVGRNVLTVQFGIFKLVCTNGLIVSYGGGVLYQQKHIGIKPEEFRKDLIAALSKVDELCENAVSLVESCRNRESHLDVFNTDHMSPEDFNQFLNQIKLRTSLSNEGARKVITLMRDKYGDSRWGYINSITEVAQDYTLERRLELERIAGNLLAA